MKKFFKGFLFAFRGMKRASLERNMRFHLFAATAVIFMGLYFHISKLDWIIVLFCIAIILAAESFNTAIEYIVNLIRDECGVPYANKNLGRAKDIAAGAVLFCSIFAALIGVFIFYPYLWM